MAGHSIFITDDSGLSFDLAPEDELEELEDQVGGEQSEPTQRTRHFANIGLPAPDATTGPNYRPSNLHTDQGGLLTCINDWLNSNLKVGTSSQRQVRQSAHWQLLHLVELSCSPSQ